MAEKLAELRKKGKKIKETVLWTNSTPTSNFSDQNLTISSVSEYDYIKIIYRYSTTTDYTWHIIVPIDLYKGSWATHDGYPRGIVAFSVATSQNAIFFRKVFYRSLTSVRITDAISDGSTATSNNLAIPLQIIGLK